MEGRRRLVIANEIIHFRPLARLKSLCEVLGVDAYLCFRGEILPVASILQIAAWELSRGDEIELCVVGDTDLANALEALSSFVQSGFGKKHDSP